MEVNIKVLMFCCCIFLTKIVYADDNRLALAISQLLDRGIAEAHVGIVVQDARTAEVIYSKNANKLFTPASITKLLSSLAAYMELGPKFHFTTSMYIAPQVNANKSITDLYFRFSGDPEFTARKLQALLHQLEMRHINSISGDIIIDDSIFSGPWFGAGWAWESNQWFYAPPITAIIVDGNQLNIELTASDNINSVINAHWLDNSYGYRIRSDVANVKYQDSKEKCSIVINADGENNYHLSGCWSLEKYGKFLQVAVANPRQHVAKIIRAYLKQKSISFNGRIIFTNFSDDKLEKIAAINSRDLHKLLKNVLSDSDNIYAEAITKALGAKLYGSGSFKTGTLAIKKVLQREFAVDSDMLRLEDGSGNSRYNLIAPMSINKLLFAIFQDRNLYHDLALNLAISGVSGTLEYRLANTGLQRKIKAKTGTMAGVSALSGFLTTKSNKDLIFTIMINGFNNTNERVLQVKNFENAVCKLLIDQVS